jgi:hypothetical protein
MVAGRPAVVVEMLVSERGLAARLLYRDTGWGNVAITATFGTELLTMDAQTAMTASITNVPDRDWPSTPPRP